jgi:hypothetical protein
MVNPGNIITNENKNRYLGRLVKITELYPDNTKTDGDTTHFLKDISEEKIIFRIQTPFKTDGYYLDKYVKIKPIKYYNWDMLGRDELFIEIPDTIDDINYMLFPYVVELVTGSGLSENMRSENMLNKSRILPLNYHIRSTNPLSFNSSVILNTKEGQIEVELPQEIMEIISKYVK